MSITNLNNFILYKDYLETKDTYLGVYRKFVFSSTAKSLFTCFVKEIEQLIIVLVKEGLGEDYRENYIAFFEFKDKAYKIFYRNRKLYKVYEIVDKLNFLLNIKINDITTIDYNNMYDVIKFYKGEKASLEI